MEEAFLAAQLRERCVWAHAEIHTAASWGAGARAQPGAGHEHVDGQACPCVFVREHPAPSERGAFSAFCIMSQDTHRHTHRTLI